jgi:hypothetical protein
MYPSVKLSVLLDCFSGYDAIELVQVLHPVSKFLKWVDGQKDAALTCPHMMYCARGDVQAHLCAAGSS